MVVDALTRRLDLIELYEAKFLEAYGHLPSNINIVNWPKSEINELCSALDRVIQSNSILAKELSLVNL